MMIQIMKWYQFVIFFSIFLALHGVINYYIFYRFWQILPQNIFFRSVYVFLALFLASSYVVGRSLEKIIYGKLSDILIWTGSFWFAYMLYFFLFLVLIDLIRVVFLYIPVDSDWMYENKIKWIIAGIIFFVTNALVLVGYFNAQKPNIEKLKVEIGKKGSDIRIAFISDIHLGHVVANGQLKKLVELVNEQNVDIVLLGGDVIDEDIAPVVEKDMGLLLEKFSSKYGTYAIAGNHEYIGGIENAIVFFNKHRIKFLRDESVLVDNKFYIVGRDDKSVKQFKNERRKEVKELVSGIDFSKTIILLDHQPYSLKNSYSNGIDLQLSGHTHHGQMWPLNFITSLIYEVSTGYKKINNTNFFVSSGFGTWGPPIKIGSSSQIVIIDVGLVSID